MERARPSVGLKRREARRVRVHFDPYDQGSSRGEAPLGGPMSENRYRGSGSSTHRKQGGTEDPEAWEKEISKVGAGGDFIFLDGSLLEGGNVAGGAFIVAADGGENEVECGVGTMATVWDSEVAGMVEGLARLPRDGRRVLILADSRAAIAAVKKAEKARSHHLRKVANEIAEWEGGGVRLGWVKALMGILGNEAADVLVKQAAEGVPPDDHEKWMSRGGIKQWTK